MVQTGEHLSEKGDVDRRVDVRRVQARHVVLEGESEGLVCGQVFRRRGARAARGRYASRAQHRGERTNLRGSRHTTSSGNKEGGRARNRESSPQQPSPP